MVQGKRFPFSGIPSGWFALGFSEELAPGAVVARSAFGKELVVYRTASGRVVVLDAFCPHLGAHIGHQGRVEGERLRCTFHGFQFDCSGRCVETAYENSKAPATARLRAWPARELSGVIIVWHEAGGAEPAWQVPELDTDGWSDWTFDRMRVASHPQETSENSVDLGHFNEVHGFRNARIERDAVADGPYLCARYSFERVLDFLPIPLLSEQTLRVEIDVNVWGLGFSLVEGVIPAVNIRFRNLVLPTPVDEQTVDLRLGCSMRELPVPLLTAAVRRGLFEGLWHEVRRDAPIWETKRYVERPALARGDGPIGLYRRWAKQFYPAAI